MQGAGPSMGRRRGSLDSHWIRLMGWLLVPGILAAVPAAVQGVEWTTLRRSVVDLDVFRPGDEAGVRTYGFALTGVPGIVACHRAVAGAERVEAHTADGGSFRITDFVADDPALDLVVLRTPQQIPVLERGSHELLSVGQSSFVILPPSVTRMDTYRVKLVNVIEAPDIGSLVVLWGDISTGLPVADSLGKVVGVIEAFHEGSVFAVTAIPIARVADLMARPDVGGSLTKLGQVPAAPWTRPDEPEGAQVLGSALCRTQRYSTGLPFLTRAVQQKPDLVEAKLELGMAYQTQQDFAEAQRLYQEVLATRPNYARAQVFLGSSYFSQGQYDKAKKHYELALAQEPDNAMALVNLGGVLFQTGDRAAAEEAFKHAIAAAPDMGLAHYNLGMLYFSEGRAAEMQQTLDFLNSRGSGFAQMLLSRTTKAEKK
jgi:Tfp pilus assembly protein PilF